MADSEQYVTFHLDGQCLGVPVGRVQEVLRRQTMTRVPLAAPVISGLINLRGQIVTALDLRRLLGMPERPAAMIPMNIIIRADGGPVSLLVDEIGEVLAVDEDTFETVPDTALPRTRDLIIGVYKLAGPLLLVLDLERVLQQSGGGDTPMEVGDEADTALDDAASVSPAPAGDA